MKPENIYFKFAFRGLGGLLFLLCLTASYAHAQDEIDLQPTLLWEGASTYGITSISFSYDGLYLASGYHEKTVKIWETNTGKEIRTLKGHTDVVYSVAFSPARRYLASGSSDNTVKIWEVDTWKEIQTLKGHTSYVWSVAFSPNEHYLASGSWDNTIKIWEVDTWKEIQTLKGHTSYVGSVAFSPDGRYLASGSWDNTIKIWEANTGKEIRTLKGHTDEVCSVAFSPDGRYLASGSGDKTLKLWEAETGKLLFDLNDLARISNVTFSPNGKTFFSNWGNVYSTQTGEKVAILSGQVYCAMSVDGKYYAIAFDAIRVYKSNLMLQVSYSKEIAQEMAQSKLFLPKDEFETQAEYEARQKKAEQFTQELNAKYEVKREQEIHASTQEKCYRVEKLSTYNPEKRTFDITAVGKTQTVSIPRDEARSLKENLSQAKVCGVERLQFYGTGTEVVNMCVLHPVSGKRYPFGEQINLPTEASLPAVSKTEEKTKAPPKNKEKTIQEPETPKEKPNTEDKTPPAITFENLPTNSPSKAFALNGWAKDANGIKSIQINNEEIPFFPNGRFEKEIQLKQGQNSILVQASDLAGNTSKKTVNLAYQFTGKFPMPKRLALVVGNGQYQPPLNLQKPRADAEAISEALKNLNFEVITLYDANKENMDKAIENFKERLKKENFEVALFYFAGHGAQVEHSLEKTTYNFLAPVDAKLKDAERVNYECVNAQLVMDLMTVSGTKVNIMLLDACRDNPFHAGRGGKIRTIQGSDATKGSVISYATSAGGLSLEDGEGKNSRYTTALLKYIGEPNRSIVEIMQDVTKEVSEKTKNDQIPSISSSLTSNFYFVVEE